MQVFRSWVWAIPARYFVASHHYTDEIAATLPFRRVTYPAPVAAALRSARFAEVDVDVSSASGEHRRAILRARAEIIGNPR